MFQQTPIAQLQQCPPDISVFSSQLRKFYFVVDVAEMRCETFFLVSLVVKMMSK